MKVSALSLVLVASACGGSGSKQNAVPDASPLDAGPMQRLDVVIDDMEVCPDGWTAGPTATQRGSLIEIQGACSTDVTEVLLQFAPVPEPGGTAPCTQATMQINGGPRVNCRVNNQVLMAPEGMLTLLADPADTVNGECGCTGDEQGGSSVGGASFQLVLDTTGM